MFNEFETKLTPESNWEIRHINILKGFHIAESENELKNGNFLKLDTNELEFSIEDRGEKDFVNDTKDNDKVLYTKSYILHIKSPKHHIQIRTYSKLPLEYIIFHATMKADEDIGRPLTNNPHLSHILSPLEGENYMNQNYRGFLNLIILALVVSHLRLMYENYLKYGLLISPKNIYSFISESHNFVYLTASFVLIFSAIFLTFLIEKALGRYKNNVILKIMHFANLVFLLFFPVYMHKFKIVNPAVGVFVLGCVTIVFLKLYSYIHFWYDVRLFIANKNRLLKTDAKSLELQQNIYRKIEDVISNYPRNLSIKSLLLFMAMPVLCFQYEYPRTDRIRKRYLFIYFFQFVFCNFISIFIFTQYMMPTVYNSMKFVKDENYIMMVERVMKLAIPNLYGWILMFYAFFHCWMNFLAELTRFSDRNFYKDWWNSIYLDQYWRTWNLPTHFWLYRHIYNPLKRRKVSSFLCGGITFFVSGIFHEYIISGALGYINYWAFIAMFVNFPVCIGQYYLKNFLKKLGYENMQFMNVLFWISFCFLGQPLCFIIYTYNYYVREGKL